MKFKYKNRKINDITLNWLYTIPKIINENACWIPYNKPETTGYVHITIENKIFMLHRLSMCLNMNIDYKDEAIETRHSINCIRACFNPDHLCPGNGSDNQKDRVIHGNHYNANKLKCPNCESLYVKRFIRTGIKKGKFRRDCPKCSNKWNKKVKL